MIAPEQHVSARGLPDWSLIRRALFIRLRSIGDTVLMTPCLEALKSWRPEIRTAVVSEPLAAPLLEGHPLVDELIVSAPALPSRLGLVSELRRRNFDVAFNMHGGTTATLLAALSGARHTFGYRGYRCSFLLSGRAPSPDELMGRSRVHSVEQQLALLRWAGVPWPERGPKLSLAVSPEAEARMRDRLSASGSGKGRPLGAAFACLAPAAAEESKRWPAAGFARVADHLREKWDMRSIVIAGRGQEHLAREVARQSRAEPLPMTGLSLKEMVALVGLSSAFVGNDSGPMHVASALGRPVVAIFGSSNPDVWHPWTDSPYRVVTAPPGLGARAAGAPPIARVSAGQVIDAVDETLGSRAEARAGRGPRS